MLENHKDYLPIYWHSNEIVFDSIFFNPLILAFSLSPLDLLRMRSPPPKASEPKDTPGLTGSTRRRKSHKKSKFNPQDQCTYM